jgi:hypothetical protein
LAKDAGFKSFDVDGDVREFRHVSLKCCPNLGQGPSYNEGRVFGTQGARPLNSTAKIDCATREDAAQAQAGRPIVAENTIACGSTRKFVMNCPYGQAKISRKVSIKNLHIQK